MCHSAEFLGVLWLVRGTGGGTVHTRQVTLGTPSRARRVAAGTLGVTCCPCPLHQESPAEMSREERTIAVSRAQMAQAESLCKEMVSRSRDGAVLADICKKVANIATTGRRSQ